MIWPPPPPPEQPATDTNMTGMEAPSLQDILKNVRQHLDTVYDENGVHHEGNQNLGEVVRSSENGTYEPTVLLDKTEENQGISSDQEVTAEETDSTTSSDQVGPTHDTDPDNELQSALQAVRAHLDVVYPEDGNGEPIAVNQNLGDVIAAVEAHQTPEPTKPESVLHAQPAEVDSDVEVDTDTNVDASQTTDATDIENSTEETEGSDNAQASSESTDVSHTSETPSNELADTLQAVRSHLDSVYPADGNGEPLSANQTLGDVIASVESGQTPEETVIDSDHSQNIDNTHEVGQEEGSIDPTQDGADVDASHATDATDTENSAEETEGSESTQESSSSADVSHTSESPSNELADTLKAVRQHLDTVYPEGNNGEPVSVNQNLGQVIRDVSTGNVKPTVANSMSSSHTVINDEGQAVTPMKGTGSRVTTMGSSALMASSGAQQTGNTGLEHLLPQLRAHLDQVFDSDGNYTQTSNESTSLKTLIQDFQERTGSGGIVGPAQAATTVVSAPIAQQSAVTEVVSHPPLQQAEILGGNNSGETIHSAAQQVASALGNVVSSLQLAESGSRLNSALEAADNSSSQGLSLMAAAKDVAKALSSTIDTITQ